MRCERWRDSRLGTRAWTPHCRRWASTIGAGASSSTRRSHDDQHRRTPRRGPARGAPIRSGRFRIDFGGAQGVEPRGVEDPARADDEGGAGLRTGVGRLGSNLDDAAAGAGLGARRRLRRNPVGRVSVLHAKTVSNGPLPSLAQSESSLAWSLTERSFVDLSTDPYTAMSIDLSITRSIDLPRPGARAAATAGGHTTAFPTPRSSSTSPAGGRCRRRGRSGVAEGSFVHSTPYEPLGPSSGLTGLARAR
jgi:hypothetical protein